MKITYNPYLSYPIMNNLNQANQRLADAVNRMSEGKKIQKASDSPSMMHRISTLESQLRAENILQENMQDGMSLLQTTDNSLSKMEEAGKRLKELSIMYNSDIISNSEKATIKEEAKMLLEEMNLTKDNTRYNNHSVFEKRHFQIMTGSNKSEFYNIEIPNLSFELKYENGGNDDEPPVVNPPNNGGNDGEPPVVNPPNNGGNDGEPPVVNPPNNGGNDGEPPVVNPPNNGGNDGEPPVVNPPNNGGNDGEPPVVNPPNNGGNDGEPPVVNPPSNDDDTEGWIPPGHRRNDDEGWIPPGHRKDDDKDWTPPGHRKNDDEGWIPPGHRKDKENDNNKNVSMNATYNQNSRIHYEGSMNSSIQNNKFHSKSISSDNTYIDKQQDNVLKNNTEQTLHLKIEKEDSKETTSLESNLINNNLTSEREVSINKVSETDTNNKLSIEDILNSDFIDEKILNPIQHARSKIGAQHNILELRLDHSLNKEIQYNKDYSRITDTDMAKEMMNYIKESQKASINSYLHQSYLNNYSSFIVDLIK